MILDETRERFLVAIAKQVEPARIAEVHFFAPIRQGGVESGVAVIAAARNDAAPSMVANAADADAASNAADAPSEAPAEAAADASGEPPAEDDASVSLQDAAGEQGDGDLLDSDDESPYSDSEPSASEVAPADDVVVASAPVERHVIYTARYRLTLKGPDRGKWETNVTAEADAPIITVDAVVRGVQRRAGDVDDPTRMNGDEVRAALPKAG